MADTTTTRPVLGNLNTMTHNYQYSKIDRNQIRLLWLQPAQSADAPLVCKLSVEDRNGPIEYEAVSYVWGEDESGYNLKVLPFVKDEFVGHRSFLIRPNLVAALKRFRSTIEERVLWTDAVCINQDNPVEKSTQVPMMEKTYSQAKSVLVWLGESTKLTTMAMAFMQTMLSTSYNVGALAKGHAEEWEALENLPRSPWFTRRWIVQEIALAKRAALFCGPDNIDWKQFCVAVELFQEYYADIKNVFLTDRHQYTKNRLGELQALGACQLIEITSQVFRTARDGTIVSRLMSLESLISKLTMFEARSPHDTVYAMVALAKDVKTVAQRGGTFEPGAFPVETPRADDDEEEEQVEFFSGPSPKRRRTNTRGQGAVNLRRLAAEVIAENHEQSFNSPAVNGRKRKQPHLTDLVDVLAERHRPKFRVDYNQSFLRTCTDFVAFTILQSGSVDIICRPWIPEGLKEVHNLPSWLIDVTANPFRPKQDGTFVRINGNPLVGQDASQLKWYNACGHLSRASRLDRQHPDNGWGFGYFDRKTDFEDEPGENRSLFLNGFVLDTIGSIMPKAADGTIPSEWFDFGGWKNRSLPPSDELWRTLVANRDAHGKPPKAFYSNTLHDVARNQCARGSPMNIKMILATPQEERTQESVLSRILEVVSNRCMFKTGTVTNQVLGLAPADARQGDKICILAGCTVPVILRAHEVEIKGKKCQWYQLLGDAYVHGYMDGDANEERAKHGIPTQQFELR